MKAALCIGINNYPGVQNDLAGCVNDAKDWAAALVDRDFDAVLLLDGRATKAEIVTNIKELLATAYRHGDTAVITFSGHGTWVPDASGDEIDGRDEALCPHDIGKGNALLDDELAELFRTRAYGVKLIFISDSCHSGSVSRFYGQYSTVGLTPRYLPPEAWMPTLPNGKLALGRPISGMRGTMTDLLMAGCADNEYSYDAYFGLRPNGAFTRVAIDTLKDLQPGATYRAWYNAIRKHLPTADYPQTPQIYGVRSARYRKVLS